MKELKRRIKKAGISRKEIAMYPYAKMEKAIKELYKIKSKGYGIKTIDFGNAMDNFIKNNSVFTYYWFIIEYHLYNRVIIDFLITGKLTIKNADQIKCMGEEIRKTYKSTQNFVNDFTIKNTIDECNIMLLILEIKQNRFGNKYNELIQKLNNNKA